MLKVIFKLTLLTIFCLSLSACGEVSVVDDISQSEANKIVSLLGGNGIRAIATKQTSGRAKYSVYVGKSEYLRSVKIISDKGLPAPAEVSFNDLLGGGSGILPVSKNIEDLKIDRALAMELEELLKAGQGVVAAKVVVRQASAPSKDQQAASIVVEAFEGAQLTPDHARQLASRVLPGIDATKLYLLFNYKAPQSVAVGANDSSSRSGIDKQGSLSPFLFNLMVPSDQHRDFSMIFLGCLILTGVLAGALGYWFCYFRQSKKLFDVEMLNASSIRLPKVIKRDGEQGEI
ncbi:MAG TPA: hypothetical protein PKD37_01500 [Oligoflexia bacterium]|nr:hypothetical protein [Oligoflexia bacterium]HMP26651.1 hypothetical protein [Oligoflexia bacterium]